MELVKQQEFQLQINSHLAFAIRLAESSPCREGLFKRHKLIDTRTPHTQNMKKITPKQKISKLLNTRKKNHYEQRNKSED